jgi:hypothetical protein
MEKIRNGKTEQSVVKEAYVSICIHNVSNTGIIAKSPKSTSP